MAEISSHYTFYNPVFNLKESKKPSNEAEIRPFTPVSHYENINATENTTTPTEPIPLKNRVIKQLNPDIKELSALEMKILKAGALAIGSIAAGQVIGWLTGETISLVGRGFMLLMGLATGCSDTWHKADQQRGAIRINLDSSGMSSGYAYPNKAGGYAFIPGPQPPLDEGWCGTAKTGIGFFDTMLGTPLRFISSVIPQMFMMNAVSRLYNEVMELPEEISFDRKVTELSRMDQPNYEATLAEAAELSVEEFRAHVDLEPLKELNPTNPSRALMPILARLRMLEETMYKSLEEIRELTKQGNIAGADKKLRHEVIGLIRKIVYYKHLLLDPTRPQLGVIIGNSYAGEVYHSLLSHYIQQSVPFSLSPFHNLQESLSEFHALLTEEERVYNDMMIRHFNGAEEPIDPTVVVETDITPLSAVSA